MKTTAKKIGVCENTAFNMHHKILLTLEFHLRRNPIVQQGISELDETYVLECFKGKKLDKNSSRKPRKYGAKASLRGLSSERICIMSGVQRNGGPAYATTINRGHPSNDKIKEAFNGYVGAGSVVFTDGLKGYKLLEDIIDCVIESIPVKEQKSKGTVCLNNVNSFHSHIKKRYDQYRGVSTKYMNRYNSLFAVTYRKKEDLEDAIYKLLLTPQDISCPITCKDVYNTGLIEV